MLTTNINYKINEVKALIEKKGLNASAKIDLEEYLDLLLDLKYEIEVGFPIDKSTIEGNWESWKDIILNEDGSVNIEQLKKELSDFSFILDQVPEIYYHITGGNMSKPMYHAKDVICVSDDYQNEHYGEVFKDFLEDMEKSEKISEEVKNILTKEIERYL